jgi:hypothetical protein
MIEISLYITDKLFRNATYGLTIEELLHDDARLANLSGEELQSLMNILEEDKLVCCECGESRYRPLVFATFEDLCRAKTTSSSP